MSKNDTLRIPDYLQHIIDLSDLHYLIQPLTTHTN